MSGPEGKAPCNGVVVIRADGSFAEQAEHTFTEWAPDKDDPDWSSRICTVCSRHEKRKEAREPTVDDLKAEVERLKALLDKRWKDARLLHMAPDGRGAFEVAIQSDLAGLMADHLLHIMQLDGGNNFVQIEASHPDVGPITFSIEKRFGRSPARQIAEAKVRLTNMRHALDVAREALGAVNAKPWIGDPLAGKVVGAIMAIDEAVQEDRRTPAFDPTAEMLRTAEFRVGLLALLLQVEQGQAAGEPAMSQPMQHAIAHARRLLGREGPEVDEGATDG